MSVFPEEMKKADEISRKEENMQRYRAQLIEQSILLQTSNINDRLMKRRTRTLTQSMIKSSFIREAKLDDSRDDSLSTRSSLLSSQLLSNVIGQIKESEFNDQDGRDDLNGHEN